MEALLPSEIARLVFGYLEDHKCDEAARSFLEASPHLQECRAAVLKGRRFNSRVNGCTLVDIFDKFSAAHSLVQERLSKVADCEQVRQCGDLLEQLRFLIGGSRGQRFVVNINVPSQANSQTYCGSPVITSSIRKRHHSSSDRDRTKRAAKPLHQLFDKPEPVSSQRCDTVEATPLESLPGHTNLSIPHRYELTGIQDSEGACCTSTKNDSADCLLLGDAKQTCYHSRMSHQGMEQENSSRKSERYSSTSPSGKDQLDERHMDNEPNKNLERRGKTMATSTDELTTYSSIEVQTTPYALSESESNELDDEPIENLSLLTKELLNRTELQERIAENINKAILPIEMPSKDESICESMGGELNTSIMTELNNAIKSIVAATETDPIFEHFLDEIIGPNIDTDTSPDEDPDIRIASEPPKISKIHEEPSDTTVVDMELEEKTSVMSSKCLTSSGTSEIPLKQRLRSSSRQQNNKPDEEGDKPKDVEKTDSSLEDHNAAAVMSIINANIVCDKNVEKGPVNTATLKSATVAKPTVIIQPVILSQSAPTPFQCEVADSTEAVQCNPKECKSIEQLVVGKSLCDKPNPAPTVSQKELISEQEMMAMPTLIVCSREDMKDCISMDALYSTGIAVPSSEARFVPIAPKGSEGPTPLYLRTVQVPKNTPSVTNNKPESGIIKTLSSPKISGANRKRNRKVKKKIQTIKPAVCATNPTVDAGPSLVTNKEQVSHTELESITLYANDNSFGTMIETGNMPAINLDDSMTLTGTGLSPYLKFHDSKNVAASSESPHDKSDNRNLIEALDTVKHIDEQIVLPHSDSILISRRTPKSLLKSRSKNNRLSMSTPRRRSSHIRALDFNTPMKSSSSEHKMSGNKSIQFSPKSSKRARSVCRTSLFKSPPFTGSATVSQKSRTPVKDRQFCKVPIATRSPAPKLMGGWEKYTGVGMILGGTSPHPSSSTTVFEEEKPCSPVKSSPRVVKKSWDADLRQALEEYQQPTFSKSVNKKVADAQIKGTIQQDSTTDGKAKGSKSEGSVRNDATKPMKSMQREQCTEITKQDTTDTTRGVVCTEDNAPVVEMKQNAGSETQVESSFSTTNVKLEVRHVAQAVDLQGWDVNAASSLTECNRSDQEIKNKAVIHGVDAANKTKEKPAVRKYAKLKTLETKISKYKKDRIIENPAVCSGDSSQNKSEYLKVSPESRSQLGHISRMIDLETPRKEFVSCTGIPPTPRVLSPSSSTITPFTKVAEELSKVPSFVNTPDFPPTPSIALTPKVIGENTIDAIKNGEYGTCSPYYQPSTEQPNILEKLVSGLGTAKENMATVVPANINSGANNATGNTTEFVMNTSSSKLEITQFEVIKENLPREEANKELKISSNSKNVEDVALKLDNPAPSMAHESGKVESLNTQLPIHNENSSSSSGNESSDSSSSASSSSSSSSSSCSCSSIATTSTPFKAVTKCKTKSNTLRETSNDYSLKHVSVASNDHNPLNDISPIMPRDKCIDHNEAVMALDKVMPVPKGETSPVKLLSLVKTQAEVDASIKETPAKDEALLSEADISETPSSSKAGIETLTNLNSKISALDSPRDRGTLRQTQLANKANIPSTTRSKPRVICVQHLLPDVSIALKPPLVSDTVSTTTQHVSNLSAVTLDAKLSMELEEKRLRLMAKLKNKPQTKIIPQKVKARQVKPNTKINYKDRPLSSKSNVPKSPVQDQTRCVSQTTSHDAPIKKDGRLSVKKKLPDKNNKTRVKLQSENPGKRTVQSKSSLAKSCSKDRKQTESTRTSVEKLINTNKEKDASIENKDDTESLKVNKITRLEDQQVTQKKEALLCNAENSTLQLQTNHRPLEENLPSADCPAMQSTNNTEVIRDAAIEAINATNTGNFTLTAPQKCDPTCKRDSTDQSRAVESALMKRVLNCSEDAERGADNVCIPVKKSHVTSTSKVDQIKRDLFSDEENNDQRTTRSKTRQLSDVQKNDPIIDVSVSVPQAEATVCESVPKKPKEELASVLECLKLVPANKTETVEKTSSSPKSSIHKCAEYDFIYDDSISTKKKRRKFSSSDLQYVINVELPNAEISDENYTECPRLMTSTCYEEIFNHSPKPKKRVVTKKLGMKSLKHTKVDASKASSSLGTILEKELIKPLSTTSTTESIKTHITKVGRSTTKIQQKSLKPTDKDDKKKPKDGNQLLKKRKITESEDDQSGEKKRRISDPQTLLKKLDLDLFLTTVHGPVSN